MTHQAERAQDIMELLVVFDDEEAPDGFMTIHSTPSGFKANFDQMLSSYMESRSNNVHLAYRRREKGENGPAICGVCVVYVGRGETLPGGYRQVRSPNGHPANIVPKSQGVYLCAKLQAAAGGSAAQSGLTEGRGIGMSYDGYSLEPAIQDVCVICAGKNEQPPEGFTLVRKSLNTRALALRVG